MHSACHLAGRRTLQDELGDLTFALEAEAAIVRYAQRSTRTLSIDDATYQALAKHFSVQQMIEICLDVGLAQITNRFNATFLTEVDDYILEANEQADRTAVHLGSRGGPTSAAE